MASQDISNHDTLVLALEPLNRMTATEAVAQRLLGLLNDGLVKPGDRLPPERELAVRLGVGRTTLREALKLLTLSGLLDARRGSGTFVRDDYSSFVANQMRWPALLRAQDVDQIFEVREALEVKAASLAAQRVTQEDIERIAVYRELESIDERDTERATDIDLAFHLAIADASHNPLLSQLMKSLHDLLRQYIELSNELSNDLKSTLKEHGPIYAAIVAKDPQAAARAMASHVAISRSWIDKSMTRRRAGDTRLYSRTERESEES